MRMLLAAGAFSDSVAAGKALLRISFHPARDFAALLAVISH